MTKAELVEEVARAAELNKRDAEVIVETVFDSIISALHKGEKGELAALAVSEHASAARDAGEIPRRASQLMFQPSACLTSSPAKSLKSSSPKARMKTGQPYVGSAPTQPEPVAASTG